MEITWDPQLIEQKSMQIIESYLKERPWTVLEKSIVKRVIHTTGDPGLVDALRISPEAARAGWEAVREGKAVFTDVNMLKAGINQGKVQAYGGQVLCAISDAETIEAANKAGITRAAAAVKLLGKRMDGAVVAIGNAPTALFELLNLIQTGICRPAMVVGTPVGFVGAAESKELLMQQDMVPYITLPGTRGGSPIAASIINALLYYRGDEQHG